MMMGRRRRIEGDDDDMEMEEYLGGGGGEGEEEEKKKKKRTPGWLGGLIGMRFFGGCGDHAGRRKNEKNVFCLLCCLSICPHCLPLHPNHPLLQVRRYVYQDVIRLDDLEKLLDCSYIQPYTINSAKVIFLKQRPQSRPCKGAANLCLTCDRILQDPFHFCSLSCKVNYMEDQGEDISTMVYRIDWSDHHLSFPQFEGLRMDGSEMIIDEMDGQMMATTSSTTTSLNVMEEDEPAAMQVQYINGASCSNDTSVISSYGCDHDVPKMMKKKKKPASGFIPGIVLSLSNRRKGAPHRAPLS